MSAKFLALLVLVKLFGVGKSAALEHIHDEISHKAGQTDGTSNGARLDEMTLERFTWTYKASTGITSLTVCTAEPFATTSQTVQQLTLLTTINNGQEENCEGVIEDPANNCATFTGTDNCNIVIPSGAVTYTLVVRVSGTLLGDANKSGTASFTMTVEAATLTCGSTPFIRAEGIGAQAASCEAAGVENVCYKAGNLLEEPFCFTEIDSEPSDLTLCIGGDNHNEQETDGELTITQLAHNTPAGPATFSLTHAASGSNTFEAIVLKDSAPLKSCSVAPVSENSGTCTVDLTGGNAEYEVCTIIPTLVTFQTAVSAITDLDLQAEEGLHSLQFRFTNANPYMKYVVKLETDPPGDAPPTVNIDCTGVMPNHICYGFIEKSGLSPFLTVEYLADDETTSNKISISNPGFPVSIL